MIKSNSLSHNSVRFLDDMKITEAQHFGAKANGLVEAITLGAKVPHAFAISYELAARIASERDTAPYVKMLSGYVELLLKRSPSQKIIVRSSSLYEDKAKGIFSGLFDTYLNIETTEQLVNSIVKIVRNAKLESLAPYFEKFSLNIDADHMGIIVQSQVSYELAGIAQFSESGVLVEFSHHSFDQAISGKEQVSSFMLQNGMRISELNLIDNSARIAAERISTEFNHQNDFIDFARSKRLSIEFALTNSDLLILQSKSGAQVDFESEFETSNFGDLDIANKTFAMRFFIQNGLFTKPCEIVSSGWTVNTVTRVVERLLAINNAITIRFSEGKSIGLPRTFAKSTEEALTFVRAHGKRNYDIIIHGYIDVIRSIEILISEDGFVLEHVPGMWESPNKNQPDVIVSNRLGTKVQRFLQQRDAILDISTKAYEDVTAPLKFSQIEDFRRMGDQIREAVLGEIKDQLPVNVHAVWDSNSNNYQCLNIRPGFQFSSEVEDLGSLFQVTKASDLERWDGEKIVRLTIATNRGDERSLISIANKLSSSKLPVVVDFGLLSHPAMVLREYGCRLIPSYLVQNCFDKNEYETLYLPVDTALSAVERILNEPPIMENSTYHVVRDREPVSSRHTLCVSKAKSQSAFDTNMIHEVKKLFEKFCVAEPALFYERGRAMFCTSGFTTPQDHFHMISGVDVKKTIENILEIIGGEHYASLASTYANVPTTGEYIVYGSEQIGYFLVVKPIGTKRLLRQCVTGTG